MLTVEQQKKVIFVAHSLGGVVVKSVGFFRAHVASRLSVTILMI
jgi:predicted alpha/beta hydrolase family esterase